ncbi:phage tail protein [Clostridium baratii]
MSELRSKKGCRSCYIAFRNEDGRTFKNPEPLEGLSELSYAYKNAEGSLYLDDILKIYEKKPTSAEISLTFGDVPTKLISRILGKKYIKGGVATSVKDKPVPVAILFQETYNDGSYKNIVFYNVTLAKDENSAKTASDTIEYQLLTLSGMAMPFTNDEVEEVLNFELDSAESDVDTSKLENFFKAVQYLEGDVKQPARVLSEELKLKEQSQDDEQEIKEKEVRVKGSKSNTGKEKE